MLIQVNTDNNVQGREEVSRRIESMVRSALDRFGDRLTRVEIHLGDVNSDKKGGDDDKRCMIEGRLAGQPPIAVTEFAPTIEQAVDGALDKFEAAADTAIGKERGR